MEDFNFGFLNENSAGSLNIRKWSSATKEDIGKQIIAQVDNIIVIGKIEFETGYYVDESNGVIWHQLDSFAEDIYNIKL